MRQSGLSSFAALVITVYQLASCGAGGVVEEPPPPEIKGGEVWAVACESGKARIISETTRRITSPVADDGLLFVGTENGLIALDRQNGRTKWHCREVGRVEYPPVVCAGLVCVAGHDRHVVHGLEAASGKPRWKHDLDDKKLVVTPLLLSGGTLLFGSSGKNLCALEARSGHPLWSNYTSSTPRWVACVADGVVYVKAFNRICGFDLDTGRKTWQHQNNCVDDGSAPTVAKGIIYLTCHSFHNSCRKLG